MDIFENFNKKDNKKEKEKETNWATKEELENYWKTYIYKKFMVKN